MPGYERKSLQILGGGFSCLPPTDKVPITDYLLAQNWRVDALGRLVSRAGYASDFSIAGAGLAHSAGSFGGIGDPLYVGCNSGITAPTSKVYYNQVTTPIATGFDGNRIAFCAQNGFMWVMNRGNQGRHSAAAGWQSWNLTPPPASPTVAAGSISGPQSITAGSNATAAVLTVGTAPSTGIVFVSGFTGAWAAANGQWTATNLSGTTFSIPVNSTAFGAITGVPMMSAAGAGVTYTYTVQGSSSYVHSLNIAGTTYSFPESVYDSALIYAPSLTVAQLMANIASVDPNCSVTYPGTGNDVLIEPLVAGISIPVSGSDSNAPATLGTPTNLPSGTYQIYLTFQSADLSLESNPSASSAAINVTNQSIAVTIPSADAPVDTRIGFVNIYATGGTLAAPYRIGQVPSTVGSPATTFLATIPDLQATQAGITMPTQNDPPPAASGMIGPYFGLLYSWSTAANVNRLFWTNADLPQYWPGSGDPQIGNWVDVGDAGEAIVWCSIHGNLLVIYKERSIWMIIGSNPSTDTLERVYEACGLSSQFGLAPAGLIDYFVGPNGLYVFDLNEVHELPSAILPIFNKSITNAGTLTPPGSILPASAFNSTAPGPYAVALGHANGKLYVSYAEKAGFTEQVMLVYNEGNQPESNAYTGAVAGRWFYHRNVISSLTGFFGFIFDGVSMVGLGATSAAAVGMNVDDFRGFLAVDPGPASIECVYQSHYEDCGVPDNPKEYLEVAIDYECPTGTFSGTVYAGFGGGSTALTAIGTIVAATARTTTSYNFSAVAGFSALTGGVLSKNISVALAAFCTGEFIIHNVYLYYYEEARLALVATTLPTDLGVGKIKQCRELELDIAAPNGTVAVVIQSDLPGNALASRQTPTVASAGRAIIKYPFSVTEGLLWKVVLTGNSAKTFQLYKARLLMRVMAIYVEGYESTAGFVWDSMQQDLGDGDVKTFDELRFDMEAGGASSVTMLTDLPGEAFAVRAGGALTLTAGSTSRAWVTVPLPDPYGASAIEGRSIELQVTGNTGFKLYKAQARYNRIGRYLMGTAPDAANDAFTTLEFDFSTERAKMFKRLEIDMRAAGTVNMTVITDQAAGVLSTISGPTALTTTGRQTLLLPMPPGVRGRLLRLILTSTAAARIYRIRVWSRPLTEPNAVWKWEDFPLEASDVVPTWKDLIAEDTTPVWQWVDLDMSVTEG